MKKQTLFLVAGLAAFTAGIVVNGSAFATQAAIPLESADDLKLATALSEYSNISYLSVVEHAPSPNQDKQALMIGDGAPVDGLTFDCSSGDPLAGISDFSLLSRNSSMSYLFSQAESVKLCSANIDWDELAKFPSLSSLFISPINDLTSMDNEDYLALRDETEGKPIVDISGISKLSGLRSLTIVGVPLGSLQTITDLPYLSSLYLNADYITSIDSLNNMPNSQNVIFDFSFNNIQDARPLMDFCVEHNNCADGDWQSLFNAGLVGKVLGNKMVVETDSETPELPGLIYGILKALSEPGIMEDGASLEDSIATEGLSYSYDDKTVKLDTSASKHVFKIVSAADNQERFTVVYKYTGSTNPDTGDTFNPGWMMGIAAVILATSSFVVCSRR